jgi:hypothetical protein
MEEQSVATDEEFADDEIEGDVDDELEPDELPDLDEYDDDDDDEDDDTVAPKTDAADVEDDDDDEDDTEDEEDDEEAEESLDVLLAREKVLDEDEVGRPADEPREALSVPAGPIGDQEFTCRSCFLVKRRAQLANERKLICLDCA